MNAQISKIAVFSLILLAALIVGTTYWQSWAAGGLAARQDNAIQRVAEFKIKRGLIFTSDHHTVLAANVKKTRDGQTYYFRRYPTHGLASQVVGYSTQGRSRAGIERQENGYLTASNANLGTIMDKLSDKLRGTTVTGNNLILNIRANPQKLAESALAGTCGAAVVLNPKTGAVYVMASSPGFDPNKIESPNGYASIIHSPSACPGSSSALLNRATQGLYAPGSTFKTVTASAALDAGTYTRDSRFYDPGYCTEYGKRVYNSGNPDQNGPEQYGNVNLVQAFQHSINAVFCNIGQRLGARRVLDKAKDFGFYSTPPLELPANERAPSGLYNFKAHSLIDDASQVDPGRLAFGQERMLVTPLQMALVAAGIANGGKVMTPRLVKEVRSPGGSLVMRTHPSVWRKAVKPTTAASLNQMMQAVVQRGTGTNAQIPDVAVAGKTGTAQNDQGAPHAWFIGFAPAEQPRYAVAVIIENGGTFGQEATGGVVAAPVGRQVLEAALAP